VKQQQIEKQAVDNGQTRYRTATLTTDQRVHAVKLHTCNVTAYLGLHGPTFQMRERSTKSN